MTPYVKDQIGLRTCLRADYLNSTRAARLVELDVANETKIDRVLVTHPTTIVLLDTQSSLRKLEAARKTKLRALVGPNKFGPALNPPQTFYGGLGSLERLDIVQDSNTMTDEFDPNIDQILFRQESNNLARNIIFDKTLCILRKTTFFRNKLCHSFLVPRYYRVRARVCVCVCVRGKDIK